MVVTEGCATSSARRNRAQKERNKNRVVDFFERVFRDHDLSVINQHVSPNYIQHNPFVADGREAFLQFLRSTWPPGTPKNNDLYIERVAADGDYVWLHASNPLVVNQSELASVSIFRLKNNLIVEGFDVFQTIPQTSANPHPMFNFLEKEYKSQCQFVRRNVTAWNSRPLFV